MGRTVVVLAVVALVLVTAAGSAVAVTVQSFPQRITQSDHDVTAGKKFSIDARTTVFSGSGVAGYDVTVRNDGSTKLSVNVTVMLRTVDGTLVANASGQDVVLTGTTNTFAIRFDAAVAQSSFDRVRVNASAS